ncbi:hypothetical protein [Ruania rhizosphaerae]|uniref:hypothetical protein n=1 Tax=Ruania rhizosphaerae TaxID=1840413 RepID=UPI00135A884C|nr:hypothetical protein [Ruania rhizosphaerae]
MTSPNDVRLQVLHTVRILGYAGGAAVSKRAGIPPAQVDEVLLDAQAAGQVVWSQFTGDGGWSLTEAGKTLGEVLLAEELDRAGARVEVEAVMTAVESLNWKVTNACTRWQLAELGIREQTISLAETVEELANAGQAWATLEEQLVRRLPRFDGYYDRFSAALDRARTDPSWVTATDRESAHRIWFELHEDLLATLGRSR